MKLFNFLEDVLHEISFRKDSGKLTTDELINILKQNTTIFNLSIDEEVSKSAKVEENDNASGFLIHFNGRAKEIRNSKLPKFSEFSRNKNPKYVDIKAILRNGDLLEFTGSLKIRTE